MTQPITNSYRAQIIEANNKVLRRLGPSVIKAKDRDEIVRVLEEMAERLREKSAGCVA